MCVTGRFERVVGRGRPVVGIRGAGRQRAALAGHVAVEVVAVGPGPGAALDHGAPVCPVMGHGRDHTVGVGDALDAPRRIVRVFSTSDLIGRGVVVLFQLEELAVDIVLREGVLGDRSIRVVGLRVDVQALVLDRHGRTVGAHERRDPAEAITGIAVHHHRGIVAGIGGGHRAELAERVVGVAGHRVGPTGGLPQFGVREHTAGAVEAIVGRDPDGATGVPQALDPPSVGPLGLDDGGALYQRQ